MPTSIRLSPAIEARLDQLAEVTGRTKAYYLRELIEQGIDGRIVIVTGAVESAADGLAEGA